MYKFFSFIYNSIRGVKKMRTTYTVIIHKEEDGFWGECKEIEGCFAQAKTIDELKQLMLESIYLSLNDNIKESEDKKKEIKLEVSYA